MKMTLSSGNSYMFLDTVKFGLCYRFTSKRETENIN